jgi:hypothetical protein
MPTTYAAGYGGTLTIATVTIPVQNVTVDLSRQEIDITETRDLSTYAMAGRLTRKISCTAFSTTVAETALTNLINLVTDTKAVVAWNDGNSGTSYSITCMLNSASRSYDGQGAATINFSFSEARSA